MELSLSTENALALLSVGAVDFNSGVGSTRMDKLKPSDVSAALGAIEDKRWRCALELSAGLESNLNIGLFKLDLIAALTLVNKRYVGLIGSDKKAVKLFAAIDCALDRLMGSSLSRESKCARIGVKKSAYDENWKLVEMDAVTILSEWLSLGEQSFLSQLYGGRE